MGEGYQLFFEYAKLCIYILFFTFLIIALPYLMIYRDTEDKMCHTKDEILDYYDAMTDENFYENLQTQQPLKSDPSKTRYICFESFFTKNSWANY